MEEAPPPPTPESVELLARFQAGEQLAADAIFRRYIERLTALARSRLSTKLAQRLDADDIVMSAYRSFFIGAREGQFVIAQGGDLWRLLVQITLHKLYRQVARHRADRRSIDRETSNDDDRMIQVATNEPSPEAAAEIADELEHWLAKLSDETRRIVELRLQGEDVDEIARIIGRSIKTVRRHLDIAKRELLKSGSLEGEAVICLPSEPNRVTEGLHRPPFIRTSNNAFKETTAIDYSDLRLQKQIGVGATGKVYRAFQKSQDRIVAVKFLKKTFLRDSRMVASFLAEAQTVAQLKHPGITQVFGLGNTPQGGYFIVMEYAANGDLHQNLPDLNSAEATIKAWLTQAAYALAFAHGHNVIHCDLKPGNLLLSTTGKILVTDFGFARRLTAAEPVSYAIAGTPAFMAPEQVDPIWGTVGPATDVYGLGAVLFYLLTGTPPYQGTRVADVLAQVVSARPVEFSTQVSAKISSAWLDLCRRCLAKSPDDRFASMSDLQLALNSLVCR